MTEYISWYVTEYARSEPSGYESFYHGIQGRVLERGLNVEIARFEVGWKRSHTRDIEEGSEEEGEGVCKGESVVVAQPDGSFSYGCSVGGESPENGAK